MTEQKKKYKFGDGYRHVKKKIQEKKESKKQKKLMQSDISRIEAQEKNTYSDDDKFEVQMLGQLST